MRGRKVVLLMDNFSAHELGVAQIGGLTALENTIIIWLPANTTSKWQPLDQGIIYPWKCHIRRHYIRYLVREVEGIDPSQHFKLPKVNILQAIRWVVEAWNNDVTEATIFNCFTKSSVKFHEPSYQLPADALSIRAANPFHDSNTTPADNNILNENISISMQSTTNETLNDDIRKVRQEIQRNMDSLKRGNHIQETADLDQFLNPIKKIVDDDPDFLEVYYNIISFSIVNRMTDRYRLGTFT